MFQESDAQDVSASMGNSRIVSLLLWLSLTTGFAVSVFTVVEELCLASACRDTASFTFFGVGIGWFGIAYFSVILILLWMRKKFFLLDMLLAAMVFSGSGAELRLLWIQKYIIGSWCPLCVAICGTLGIAAIVLIFEGVQDVKSDQGIRSSLPWRVFFFVIMISAGLAIAIVGVKSL